MGRHVSMTDILLGGKASKGFESLREVVRHQEGLEVLFQVLRGLVMIFFDRGCLTHLGHLEVERTDRRGLERFLLGLGALDVW